MSESEIFTPMQLAELGKQAFEKKRYSEAAQNFRAALQGYLAVGDRLNGAELANNASVALLMAHDARAALEIVEGTELVFAEAGDLRRQAMALGNRGAALQNLNRFEEAIEAYQKADDLFKQVGEHELRSHILKSLSALQLRTGRQLEGAASFQAGLEEDEQPSFWQRLIKKLFEIPSKILFRS